MLLKFIEVICLINYMQISCRSDQTEIAVLVYKHLTTELTFYNLHRILVSKGIKTKAIFFSYLQISIWYSLEAFFYLRIRAKFSKWISFNQAANVRYGLKLTDAFKTFCHLFMFEIQRHQIKVSALCWLKCPVQIFWHLNLVNAYLYNQRPNSELLNDF